MSTRSRFVCVMSALGLGAAVLTHAFSAKTEANDGDVQALSEQRYSEWVDYRETPATYSSDFDWTILFEHDSFQVTLELGVPALPYLVVQTQQDHLLGYAIYEIAKARLHVRRHGTRASEYFWTVDELPDIHQSGGPPDYRVLWRRWWEEYRPEIPRRFEALREEWKQARAEGRHADADSTYSLMSDLGVLALPAMVASVSAGDKDLIPLVSELTDGEVKADTTPEQVSAW